MALALRRRFDTWFTKAAGPRTGPVVLTHRRVYILPTAHGYGFFVVLLVMLAGSINYSLSLGFVLTFLLGGLALNAIVYTYRNLANLRVAPMRTQPVFAGETARFPIRAENPTDVDRHAIDLRIVATQPHAIDVPARSEAVVEIPVPATRRGRLALPRLTLTTRFPLGLFRAWSYAWLDIECIVYPCPEPPGVPLPAARGERGEGALSALGTDDFAGLRAYHAGDSPRRIAWKADARDQGLLTKVFSGHAENHLWLSWSDMPARVDPEARLARLARWVLDADQQGLAFGLQLPDTTITPASGAAHRTLCLEALALYEHERPA